MEYRFENLGDERFQQLCQCIINAEFPNIQAFPVGQPDGGRDAVAYDFKNRNKVFSVFQVKFVRNPSKVLDPHKWLVKIVEDEIEKIVNLVPKGAQCFYLITNVKGTSHLDVGSMDKINKLLENRMVIPSVCWWADDIARKIEANPLLKWSFPEILSGQDILNSILFSNINENREFRESVVKAYLTDQYEADRKVKFKQIDLHNHLIDLFEDVPIRLKKFHKDHEKLASMQMLGGGSRQDLLINQDHQLFEETPSVRAAEFILSHQVQDELERILLEGGPGQGKSTISQFVCQSHRIRLLDKKNELKKLEDQYVKVPLRLPFKVDLRHLAAWMEEKNPYQAEIGDDYFKRNWHNSLESFLLAHILFHSKCDNFTSRDLIAVCKLSPILLVFDGFDEIADLATRNKVVEAINSGVKRLLSNSKSLQVLITSRPAAFSDSVEFSTDLYPHFELGDINADIAISYLQKWIRASEIDSKEASILKRLVAEKIEVPYLKSLTKTPMQLAIFISLLRTRGESLPNKRTSLYDSYIDLFFNRESEKNQIVRDHRELIIEIHEYLAWLLHSESELKENSGAITLKDLKSKLNNYLETQGHDTSITEKLFQVVQERVCALVSRVQGTFEFEVQPLREYFCAKYLYKTAPYSPVGLECSGTKPERFDAISKNFYWLNVARFFAGCFDKGEIPMLVEKLKELQDDGILKFTNHPRIITSQLLSDYVFSQTPKHMREVVSIIVNGISIGKVLNQNSRNPFSEPILLPADCGRELIVDECFKQLKEFPNSNYATELLGIIANNPYDVFGKWKEFLPYVSGQNLTRWLSYAYHLQIMHKIEDETLRSIFSECEDEFASRLRIISSAGKLDFFIGKHHYKEKALELILTKTFSLDFDSIRRTKSSLKFIAIFLDVHLFVYFISDKNSFVDSPYYFFDSNFIRTKGNSIKIEDILVEDEIDEKIQNYSRDIFPLINTEFSVWSNDIKIWKSFFSHTFKSFQDAWKPKILAILIAYTDIKMDFSSKSTFDFDSVDEICEGVLFSKKMSSSKRYWAQQLEKNTNVAFKLVVLFSIGTVGAIGSLIELIEEKISSLCQEEFQLVFDSLKDLSHCFRFSNRTDTSIERMLNGATTSNKFKSLISCKANHQLRRKIWAEYFDDFYHDNELVIYEVVDHLTEKYLKDSSNIELLERIKNTYSKIEKIDRRFYFGALSRAREPISIPIEISREIMNNSKDFPWAITAIAERSCRAYANRKIVPVGRTAEENHWFESA